MLLCAFRLFYLFISADLLLCSSASLSFFRQEAREMQSNSSKKTLDAFVRVTNASVNPNSDFRVYYDELPKDVEFTRYQCYPSMCVYVNC